MTQVETASTEPAPPQPRPVPKSLPKKNDQGRVRIEYVNSEEELELSKNRVIKNASAVNLSANEPEVTFVYSSADARRVDDLKDELLARISVAMEGVATHYGYDVPDNWQPDETWVERTLVKSPIKAFQRSSGEWVMRADVLVNPVELHERYRSEQRRPKTIMLAQAYGGMIFVLGGLAVFLRLGTGLRQKS